MAEAKEHIIDIAKEEVDAVPMQPRRYRRAVADDKIVDRAFDLLKSAKRPVLLAGNGCIRRRASKQLRLFCEQTGIGVLNTFMAKGCVDVDSDYCLYTIGLGRKDLPTLVIDDADLVITLGFDMVEYHPRLWNPKGDKRIILVDGEPVGAINRVPLEGEARSNMHVGGRAEQIGLTEREYEICKRIGPVLREKGLIFTGIDVIDGWLTEINVTSPTGIQELERFDGINAAEAMWEAIERRVAEKA